MHEPSPLPVPPDWSWWTRTMRAVWMGHEPVDALPTHDRGHLVAALHALGATDRQVATALLGMTTFTAARIRTDLRLPVHPQPDGGSDILEARWSRYEHRRATERAAALHNAGDASDAASAAEIMEVAVAELRQIRRERIA